MNEAVDQIKSDKTGRKLIAELPDRIQQYKHRQRKFSLQSVLNRNFVDGNQWSVLLPGSNELFEPLQDEGEVRLTQNVIKPMVNLLRAEILSRNPAYTVKAFSGDEYKIEASDVGEQILRQSFYAAKRSGLLRRLIDGVLIDGVAYLSIDFFPKAGPVINNDPVSGTPVRAGRIVERGISTLDMLVPDEYDDLNKAPCLIEQVRMHRNDAQRMFKLDKEPAPDPADDLRHDRAIESTDQQDKENLVTVYKCFFLPGNGAIPDDGKYPEGLMLVWIDSAQKCVDARPIPYPYNVLNDGGPMYPYVDFHMDTRREHYHSQGVPEQCIPLQMELNRTVSQIMESKNYIGSPIWLAVRGQFTDVDDIPTYPGGVALYNQIPGAGPPQPVTMPAPPSYIHEIPRILSESIRSIHSASEIATAQQPGSVNSYSGLQLLQDIQSKVLAPWIIHFGDRLALHGKARLMMEQKYTDYPAQLRVTDPAGDLGLKTFYTNTDLSGDLDVVVRIEVDSQSPSIKAQQALQELQMQAITPDEYKARIYGEEKNVTEKMDAINASRENQMFREGQVPDNMPLVAFENHAVHFKYHTRFIESDEFKTLDAQVQEAIKKHAYVHLYAMKNPDAVFQQTVLPVATQLGMAPAPQPPVGNPAQGTAAPAQPPQGV